MSQNARYRVMHKFWLDITKPGEDWLDEQIHELKQTRKFTTLLRDALRLILDLRAGRLDVLFELFPWVRAEFLDHIQPVQSGAEIEMQRRLERMESLLLAQGNTPISSNSGVGKSLLKGPVAPPVYDEDDTDLLVVKKSTVNSAQNFLDAVMSLKQQTQVRPS